MSAPTVEEARAALRVAVGRLHRAQTAERIATAAAATQDAEDALIAAAKREALGEAARHFGGLERRAWHRTDVCDELIALAAKVTP